MFVKGKSGNPSGRPKEDNELKTLARKQTKAAIERLTFWMNSDNPKASVRAAEVLLDRGHGKAPQSLEHTGANGGPIIIQSTPLDEAL